MSTTRSRIISYYKDRGYGFIADGSDVRKKIFFHIREWQHAEVFPEAGQAVTYEIGPGNPGRGDVAVNVRLVRPAPVREVVPDPVDGLVAPAKESR